MRNRIISFCGFLASLAGGGLIEKFLDIIPAWVLWFLFGIAITGLILSIFFWDKLVAKFRLGQRFSRYAPGPFNYTLKVADTKVVIDNIEENEVSGNVSITGMIKNKPVAVVLNKRRLGKDLSFEELLQKYAWALLEAQMKQTRNR